MNWECVRDGWGRVCWPDALLAHCLAALVGRATTEPRLVAQSGVTMTTIAMLNDPRPPERSQVML